MYDSHNLAALIGSRICHDLISPVGAVTNGLELLAMSGLGDSPELSLVSDSAANANARIRLFRLAFGLASDDQKVSSDELRNILAGVYAHDRISVTWHPISDLSRRLAQALLLCLLCAEQAIPFGGTMEVTETGTSWTVTAQADRINLDEALWSCLNGHNRAADVKPAHVQFLLLPQLLSELGRQCQYSRSGNNIRIQI